MNLLNLCLIILVLIVIVVIIAVLAEIKRTKYQIKILEEMNDEVEEFENKLHDKILQLERIEKLLEDGEIDEETYNAIKRIYRQLLIERWL